MNRRTFAAAPLVLVAALGLGCTAAPEAPREAVGRGDDAAPREDRAGSRLLAEPTRPRSPRRAAAQVRAAERAIADPDTDDDLLARAGHAQQLAYDAVADHPGWDARVRDLLPRQLRRLAADNVASRRAFASMHPSSRADLADHLPAWRIVEPPPAARLKRWYQEAERRYGVDWEYLASIHLTETRYGRIAGTSSAGAEGPMQFIPTTWDLYGRGGDVHDPRDAILAAARLLVAHDFADDPAGALYHYNNHPAYVRGVVLHAEIMQRRPRAFLGYHQWQVHYLTRRGTVWLPEGYAARRPVPVAEWLEDHPQQP